MNQKDKVEKWLIQNHRRCPKCDAPADKLECTKIVRRLHPDAATEKSIDTSYEADIADIKCSLCSFDNITLVLDDVGIS